MTFTNQKAPPTGELHISKTVTGDGLIVTDYAVMFSFTVTLKDASGNALTESYPFYMDGGTVCIGSVKSGDTLLLRDGQSVEIRGIPAGTAYTVTEAAAAGWEIAAPAGGTATGTVARDAAATAAFTNHKKTDPNNPDDPNNPSNPDDPDNPSNPNAPENPAAPTGTPDAAPPTGDRGMRPFWLCMAAASLLGLCAGWLTWPRRGKHAP